MTETTRKDRSQDIEWLRRKFLERGAEIERLEDDLAVIERQVRAKADEMEREAWGLHDDGFDSSATIRQRDADELRAILNPPEG